MSDFRLPIGNRALVGHLNLKSNGRVDRKEGSVPQNGVANIQDSRVEKFIQSRSFESMGANWKGYSKPDFETGEITAGCNAIPMTDKTASGQFLILDPRGRKITLQTQGLQQEHFNHWIQARYDRAGQIKPDSIVEWVSR